MESIKSRPNFSLLRGRFYSDFANEFDWFFQNKMIRPIPFQGGKARGQHGTGSFDTNSAVKLHKNFNHFKYSLRVNKKNILGEYSLLLSQVRATK